MKYFSILFLSLVLIACKTETKAKVLSADDIINKSIEVSGGEKFMKTRINFDFRDRFYYSQRIDSDFVLMRVTTTVDNDSIIDILANEGFQRKTNDNKTIIVNDSMAKKYAASVNSVHYFSVLPYGLNDTAVNKKRLEDEKIKGKDFYKVKVTFNEEDGGEDYDDVFVYWIDKVSFKLSYLAYSYSEDDGMGMRFREAYNERYINGLRFVDYNNYKSDSKDINLSDLGKAFETNKLKLLSKIELENIEVNLIESKSLSQN
jgi:hypothetical protein